MASHLRHEPTRSRLSDFVLHPRTFAALLLLASTGFAANAAAWPHRSIELDRGGVVYAMTNDASGNRILVFIRDRRGKLHAVPRASVSTGGLGKNSPAIDPLGSQNALVYDDGRKMLFAVNAGDDTVTAFDTGAIGLPLRRKALVSSGGSIPVSLAVSENRLYVLNAGGSGSVATFAIGAHGALSPIGSLALGLPDVAFDPATAPGQVGVDALARHLVVTYGGGQALLVAKLDDDGVPTGPLASTPTPGPVPFAFDVTRYGTVLVAEASGSVSAFDPFAGPDALNLTVGPVATGQAATCWIVASENGFAYVSNTGSGTLSLYNYSRTGDLALLDAIAATPGGAPLGLTLADDGAFLYALDAAQGRIEGFAVDRETGALSPVETQGGLPANAGIQGLASRDF